MADEVKLHVTWECPACPAGNANPLIGGRRPFQTNLVFSQGTRSISDLTMVLEEASRDRIVDHLREHVNEIKLLWTSMESAMGALGLAMDVTVSQELEPRPEFGEDDEHEREMDWRDSQGGF
jgi:hypothetical protein